MMDWAKLLSRKRLGKEEMPAPQPGRSEFQRDFDRIVFSSAFRRLQDKTQVFPLAQTDYVRTRLTHSLESSCVGRSLGTLVGSTLLQRHPALRQQQYSEAEFGAIVAAACLGHDIGNPPFGHAGESAIQDWFRFDAAAASLLDGLTGQQQADLQRFEGNAQGFRVLTRLEGDPARGGMQLTCATLATFTKYPRGARSGTDSPGHWKKHGFMQADQPLFETVAAETGLVPLGEGEWARHPLAWLVEAADDICYNIIDAEDGYYTRYIGYGELTELLGQLVSAAVRDRAGRMEAQASIEYLRANAIGEVVQQVTEHFLDVEQAVLAGRFQGDLLAGTAAGAALGELKSLAMAKSYRAPPVVQVEAAGFNVLGELVGRLCAAVEDRGGAGRARSAFYVDLLPPGWVPDDADRYRRVLAVTDYVAGMTDSSAVTFYQRLMGISLPS